MIRKILFGLLLLLASLFSEAQPLAVGHIAISFIDSSRFNRVISTEIYYPADSAGESVPLSISVNSEFPTIVFGHGFLMGTDAYAYLWNELVPLGYIFILPATESTLSPNHLEFGKDLAFLVEALKSEGRNFSSMFYNRIDSTSCIMGHSMGGGASFLAIPFDSSVTTLVNLSAAETNPSAINIASSIPIPALIFSGENDCVTPPFSNQNLMFDSLGSPCKVLINILGASHCQMAEDNLFCNIGEASCSPAASISRAQQHATVLRYLVPWLDTYLKRNCVSHNEFDSLLISDPFISSIKNCISCNIPAGIKSLGGENNLRVYPTLFSCGLFIESDFSFSPGAGYELFNTQGQIIDIGELEGSKVELNFEKEKLAQGLMFLKVHNLEDYRVFRIVSGR